MKATKKKSVKGMTLIEIIIAIFVLGVAGTLMCAIGSTVAQTMIQTNHLTNKTMKEAPVAIAQDNSAIKADPTAVDKIQISCSLFKGDKTRDVPATSINKYSTYELTTKKEVVEGVETDVQEEIYKTNMNGNLVFYTIN